MSGASLQKTPLNTFLVNIELTPRIEESVELITAAETAPRPAGGFNSGTLKIDSVNSSL